jgi:hypothetical protein
MEVKVGILAFASWRRIFMIANRNRFDVSKVLSFIWGNEKQNKKSTGGF